MLRNLIIIGGSWIVGYAGMWLLRWILCYFILGNTILKSLIGAIIDRAESQLFGQQYPFWLAITKTFKHVVTQNDTLFAIVVITSISMLAFLRKIRFCLEYVKEKYFQLLPFAIISLGVFAYCLIVQGHPLQHAGYAYKLWVTFFFPIIAGLNFWVLQAAPKQVIKRKTAEKKHTTKRNGSKT